MDGTAQKRHRAAENGIKIGEFFQHQAAIKGRDGPSGCETQRAAAREGTVSDLSRGLHVHAGQSAAVLKCTVSDVSHGIWDIHTLQRAAFSKCALSNLNR